MKIRPSQRATREILSAKRSLGVGATTEQIMELTGYDRAVVRAVIAASAEKIRNRVPEPPARYNEQEHAPVFVREIQANTELLCIKVGTVRGFEEWLLLAPSGVPLLRLVGKGDILQFTRTMKESPKLLQGVSTPELETRRQNRLRGRKKNGN